MKVASDFLEEMGREKNDIRAFWDDSPCGIRASKATRGTKEFFEEIEMTRYKLEPFIHRYAQFKENAGKRVLEVGCGTGTDLLQFLRAGADTYGIDFSIRSIALARKRLKIFGFDAKRALVADAEELPFPDSQFDMVYSWSVLHHTPNPQKAISEIYRVLRPSGKICVMLYHKPSLVVFQLYLLFGIFAFKPFRKIDRIIADHLESPGTKAYTKAQAKMLFEYFTDLRIESVITPYDLRYKRDKFLPAWVGRFIPQSLGWFMVIRARKPCVESLG